MIVWATVQGGFIGINLFLLLFSVSGHPKIQKLQCPKKSCSKTIVWPKVQGGKGASTQAPSLLPHLNLSVARVTSPSPILQKIWPEIQMTNHAIVKLNIVVMSPKKSFPV